MIKISWFNGSHEAVYFCIEGAWIWEEYYKSIEQFTAMVDASPLGQIHVVMDFSRGAIFPKNIISTMARHSRNSHPKAGLAIVVGANGFLLSLFHILGQVAPKQMERVRFVNSLAEVPALLGESVAENTGLSANS
jgi:hypothetical protein